MRASGNSARMAMMASMPLMSGSRRSISVTSGRCSPELLHRLAAGRRLRHELHVGLVVDDRRDALAQERMVVNAEHSYRGSIAHDDVTLSATLCGGDRQGEMPPVPGRSARLRYRLTPGSRP